MDLEKAAKICADVAEDRKRWGRNAGFANYHQSDVLDAMVAVHEAGLFDEIGKHEELVLANRQKGAAEARATRAQHKVEALQDELERTQKQLADLKEKKGKGIFG